MLTIYRGEIKNNILDREQERLARLLAMETGKPIKDARVKVLRAWRLFRQAANEALIDLEGKNYRVGAYEYPQSRKIE